MLMGAWVVTACATRAPQTTFKIKELPNFNRMTQYFGNNPDELDILRQTGPFRYKIRPNLAISLSRTKSLLADVFTPNNAKAPTPLVVFIHGSDSDKEAHREQARQLASWGYFVLIADLPVRKVWRSNGRKIAMLVDMIRAWPKIIHEHVDTENIILVGHPFGGSAAIVAASLTKVKGVVFLDPALVHSNVTTTLPKVEVPAILLGADRRVYTAKGRSEFFPSWGGPFAEISILGADHDDAQFPTMIELWIGIDPFVHRGKQQLFLEFLSLSVFSIAANQGVEHFHKHVTEDVKRQLITAKSRRARHLID